MNERKLFWTELKKLILDKNVWREKKLELNG